MNRLWKIFQSIIAGSVEVILHIFPFHAAAWHASAKSIDSIVNDNNADTKKSSTILWRDSTQSQLTVVAITAALVSSVIASAFTWPSLQNNTWAIQAIWYSGLVFSLTSIAAATQQSLALYRLTVLPDGLAKIREMLSEGDPDASGRFKPRYWQLYIWQAPLLLLNSSVYLFIAGLAVLLWNASKLQGYRWETDETKIATVFTVALGVAVSNYVISTLGIYNRFRKLLTPPSQDLP